jgi:hypothetical protein
MPWKKVSSMEQKQQFVSLAGTDRFTVTELCLEFGISRKTGHKWLSRHAVGGMKALRIIIPDGEGHFMQGGGPLGREGRGKEFNLSVLGEHGGWFISGG